MPVVAILVLIFVAVGIGALVGSASTYLVGALVGVAAALVLVAAVGGIVGWRNPPDRGDGAPARTSDP